MSSNTSKAQSIVVVKADAFPLMILPTIRILTPSDVIANDESKGDSGPKLGKAKIHTETARLGPRRGLVFASEEGMLKAKEFSKETFKLDEFRRFIVNTKPSTSTLAEGLAIYKRYLNELNDYTKMVAASRHQEGEEEEEEEAGNPVVESWRFFRWNDTSLNVVRFEKCCVGFNKACYQLSAFKRWFQTDFSQWCILDLSTLKDRIKSDYVKRTSSPSSPSYFHAQERPQDFTSSLVDEIKQHASKLKELAFDFHVLSEKGFPTWGAWSNEFIGICDSNICNDFSRLCLYYVMVLNHVIFDKTYHAPFPGPYALGYDAYKSGLLLCHYREIVRLLQPAIVGFDTTPSTFSPSKHYSLFVLIMCYVRYVCDCNTVTDSLKKTGELLSIYNCLQAYLRAFVANDSSRFQSTKPSMTELLRHVDECQPILSRHNDNVTHNRLDGTLTVRRLVDIDITTCIKDLGDRLKITIPETWIPKLVDPSVSITSIATVSRVVPSNSIPLSGVTCLFPPPATGLDRFPSYPLEWKKREFITYLCLSCMNDETKIPKEKWVIEAQRCGLDDLTIETIDDMISKELNVCNEHLFGKRTQ